MKVKSFIVEFGFFRDFEKEKKKRTNIYLEHAKVGLLEAKTEGHSIAQGFL